MNYVRNEEWTSSENKQFQNAIAELDINSPILFENINAKLPWKTIQQIKCHYEKFVEDVLMDESDEICSPKKYANKKVVVDKGNHRGKGAPWTDEEHRLFLIGLDNLGKGEWKKISKYYVPTKLPSQVASHGQKYFKRLKSNTPLTKRRFSIHDIRIHNSSIVETSTRDPSRHSFISYIPHHHNLIVQNANSQHNIFVGQNSNASSSSVHVISPKYNHDIINNTPPIAITSDNNNNNNYFEMIMGYDFNVNNMCYDDQFATYDEIFSPAPYLYSEDDMPFYFPN